MSGDGTKRGLGRGLSALMGDIERDQSAAPADGVTAVRTIAIAEISPHPDQPRRHFDEDSLDELAASIAARGVIQPIVVRKLGERRYQIVAGERRWRAAQRARLHEIPALIRELSDSETLEIAIVENIQRADLNAIEEAEAYRRLIAEFGHTQEALGKFVAKSRSHVANLLRLLDLPDAVRQQVADGTLTMGHARALITAADPGALAGEVTRRGLSVRETERLARGAKAGPEPRPGAGPKPGSGVPVPDADIVALERQLGDMLGLAVQIAHGDDGDGGAVMLRYSSLDQLDMICQRLSGERF